jgi:hypothetical protein
MKLPLKKYPACLSFYNDESRVMDTQQQANPETLTKISDTIK